MRPSRQWIVLLCCLVPLGAGCSDDDAPAAPPPDDYPFAGTPDQVLENFLAAQEKQDYDEYALCLDPDFRFHLQAATVTEFGLPEAFFLRTQELAIAESMFSGDPPDPTVGGITEIDFVIFSRVEDGWEDMGDGELAASFDVLLQYAQSTPDGDKQISIRGRVTIWVVGEQVEHEGQTRTRYGILSVIDLTGGTKGVEDVLWGSLKAAYLPDIVLD